MTAPLDFNKLNSGKSSSVSQKPKTDEVKPLNFGSIAPSPKPTPVAPAVKTVGALQFGKLPPKQTPVPRKTDVQPLFGSQHTSEIPGVMDKVNTMFPQLTTKDVQRVENLVKQLLPFTQTVAVQWADKALKTMATVSGEVTQAVKEFANTRAADLLDEARKAIVDSPSFFQRLLTRDGVATYKPRLEAIRSKINQWMTQIDSLIESAKKAETDLIVNSAAFVGVVTFIGSIPDNHLEISSRRKRETLLQAVTQSHLNVAQIEQMKAELINIKAAIDHFLDVTIPAYESAKVKR